MAYDIHIEGVPVGAQDQGRFVTFGEYGRHLGVQGIHKLVMRFLKCMLTPKGSDFTDPDYGTELFSMYNSNVDSGLLSQIATQSVADTVETLQSYDAEYDVPDSERLLSAEVENLVADSSGPRVDLSILIKNIEGTTAQFLIPSLAESSDDN